MDKVNEFFELFRSIPSDKWNKYKIYITEFIVLTIFCANMGNDNCQEVILSFKKFLSSILCIEFKGFASSLLTIYISIYNKFISGNIIRFIIFIFVVCVGYHLSFAHQLSINYHLKRTRLYRILTYIVLYAAWIYILFKNLLYESFSLSQFERYTLYPGLIVITIIIICDLLYDPHETSYDASLDKFIKNILSRPKNIN